MRYRVGTIFCVLFALALCPMCAATDTGKKILTAAQLCQGKRMWLKGYGLTNGKLGCAAALSNVLLAAGIGAGHSAAVSVLRNQLLHGRLHCSEVTLRDGEGEGIDDAKLRRLAQPGDVVVAFMTPPNNYNGGTNAHCGIMSRDGNVMTNDWSDGVWKEVNIHMMFDYFPYIRLLRVDG